MKYNRLKQSFKLGGALLAIALILFNVAGDILPAATPFAAEASAATSCAGNGASGVAGVELDICLVNAANNPLNDPSGYTVKVDQTLANGKPTTYSTTFKNGEYLSSPIQEIGSVINSCDNAPGVNAGPYNLVVTATKGGSTSTQKVCADDYVSLNIYDVQLQVIPGQQYGSIHGCIYYIAPDGTKTPFNGDYGSTSGSTSPAVATLVGPAGSFSKTISLTLNSSGCLTGSNISNLPIGKYTLRATYVPNGTGLEENYQKQFTVTAGSNVPVGGTATTKESAPVTTGTTSSPSTSPPCEASGVSLSWLFCPIINGLASAADGIYSHIVQPLLQTDPINVSNPNSDPTNTYKIWSNFRIYADIFLVIVLLVVVFGESIGGGLIDAYSVKKILPRLLVAAVLINISIYLVALAIDFTNVIGGGIGNLIESPFTVGACHAATKTAAAVNLGSSGNCFALHISGGTGDIGIAAMVSGGIWAAGAAGFIEFLLLFALIPMFLTMIAVMVTVILRRGLIIFLVMVSPIAFVLYCLPNTEKYFKQWWDLLFKTLLVYPIIAVIFALANVLSVTIDSTSTGIAKNFADFISIAALFAPLFLIPYSFRIAGGLIGSFSEFATSSRKKAHEAIKGNPNDPESWGRTTRQKVKMGNIERGLTGKALATNFIPPTNPLTSGGREQWRQNREARREADRNRAGQRYAEGDAVFQTNKGNDQYLLALANPELAERRRSQAGAAEQPAWKAAIAAARITHKSPAVRLQAANTLATTGFQFSTGQAGYNELAETIASITDVAPSDLNRDADGNIIGAKGKNAGTYANSMNYAQYAARGAGRFDLGGINNGTGYNYRAGIGKASGYTAGQSKPKTYVAGAADYLKVGLSGSELQSTGELPDLTRQVAENITSGRASVEDVLAWHNKLLDAQPGATGANQDEINKQLAAIEALSQGPRPYTQEVARVVAGTRANRAARRASIDPNLLEDN